jgi:cytoskeletal protein CcmA (bactofilin family)
VFTFKPAAKNGTNGHSNGSGHQNGNTRATAGAGGNGHSETNGNDKGDAALSGDGSAHAERNGNGKAKASQGIAGWLGLVGATKGGNGNGHAAERPAPARNGNGHSNAKRIDSVIGPGLSLRGTLTGAGGIRIEGTFDGIIDIQGPLLITDGAKVTAEIRAGAVSVGGSVKGNITAGKVELLATGRVWGDLVTTAFATEEGAFLRGQVRMEDELPPAVPSAAPRREQEAERETAPV